MRARIPAALALAACAATFTGAPAANAATLANAASAGGALRVTWSGFRGVTFGESLEAAAKTLHGEVRSDEPASAAKTLVYPGDPVIVNASLQWQTSDGTRFQVRSGGAVGSFESFAVGSARVRYPHGTYAGESLSDFQRALGRRGRPERPEHNAAIGYYLVGPHGRTLWGYGNRQSGLFAIGVAESLAGAKLDWLNEG